MPLPKVHDPALVELESIVRTKLALPTNFLYATWNEANQEFDKFDPDLDYPVFVHLTSGKNRQAFNEANEVQRTLSVVGFMLNRVDEATILSTKSYDLRDTTNQMRQLVENLMYWINLSPLSVQGGVDKWSVDEVYHKGDANLYGFAVSFDWTISTGTNGYYNQAY